jgi:hypothetical protein
MDGKPPIESGNSGRSSSRRQLRREIRSWLKRAASSETGAGKSSWRAISGGLS